MVCIKVESNVNGSHDYMRGNVKCNDGWAVIPETMTIPDTFPFVNITVKDGVVTSMTAGTMPEPEPEVEPEPTQLDMIEAQVTYTAMMTDTLLGV